MMGWLGDWTGGGDGAVRDVAGASPVASGLPIRMVRETKVLPDCEQRQRV